MFLSNDTVIMRKKWFGNNLDEVEIKVIYLRKTKMQTISQVNRMDRTYIKKGLS